jgi:hypothetical protein
MLACPQSPAMPHPAVVARIVGGAAEPSYLRLTPAGDLDWVADPEAATAFDSMREATRRATRLPANLRAFGLVRGRAA